MKVLIVDDHAIVRQGLKQILLESGKVTLIGEAANGAEAMRAMREHEWSAVVLDISLPRLTGIQLCERIRHLGFSNVPVLMLTAMGNLSYKEKAFCSFEMGTDK